MNAQQWCEGCNFPIEGVSYIGAPRPNTAMFVGKKLQHLLPGLQQVRHCLVFAQQGMQVPPQLLERHCFVFSAAPDRDYGRLAEALWQQSFAREQQRKYTQAPEGYWLGENVTLGAGVVLEPGVLIGHDVEIGAGTVVLAGARIKNARLGANCLIKENAVLGGQGFVHYTDETGNVHRVYNFGALVLGSEVEVGACTTLCRGTAGNTVLQNHVKLDDNVYVAHDVHCGENVRITGGGVVGGYVKIGAGVFVGFNATLRNRIEVGPGAFIGMGSVVAKSVPAGATVYGNPARPRPEEA